MNGIHRISLNFCGCGSNIAHRVQILQASWWPSTPIKPQMCTTFPLLRLFHTMNCQGKLLVYDLWKALEIMTESQTMMRPLDHYKVLLQTIQQWHHIKQCKQARWGHDTTGIAETALGELALECPACPHPGHNIPMDWKTVTSLDKLCISYSLSS